jgi:hypothetical protein
MLKEQPMLSFPGFRPLAFIALVLLTCLSLPARAGIIAGMPDAIVCSVRDPTGVLPWERMVFYVSASMRDGDTLYKSSTSDPVVLLVSEEGVIDGANLADCNGRTIKSLEEEGRAFSFVKSGGASAR